MLIHQCLCKTFKHFDVFHSVDMVNQGEKNCVKVSFTSPSCFKSTQTGVFRIFIAFVQKGTKKVLTQFTNESKSI